MHPDQHETRSENTETQLLNSLHACWVILHAILSYPLQWCKI